MRRTASIVSFILLFSVSLWPFETGNSMTFTTCALVTDAIRIDDCCFNAAAWQGIVEFFARTWTDPAFKGKGYKHFSAETMGLYAANLMLASDEAYGLIAASGFSFAEALNEVAPFYPNRKYLIIDETVNQPNVLSIRFAEAEGSYLAGVLAAEQTLADGISDPKFGFIGGVPSPIVTKFEIGYIQGIHSVIPGAAVFEYYAMNWGKPELAKIKAQKWYDAGVYAIYSAAGGTGEGAIEQAKEYRSQGRNVWAIGVDCDQSEDGVFEEGRSAVLTSMVKHIEIATKLALGMVSSGNFPGGTTIILGVKDNGVGVSSSTPEINDGVLAKVNAAKSKSPRVKSGSSPLTATLSLPEPLQKASWQRITESSSPALCGTASRPLVFEAEIRPFRPQLFQKQAALN